MNRILHVGLAAGAILRSGACAAQGFKPTRTIDFIVHTGPGGGGDVHARAINAIFEKEKLLPVRATVVNGAELMKSSQEFIDQRRDIYKLAGIKTYR